MYSSDWIHEVETVNNSLVDAYGMDMAIDLPIPPLRRSPVIGVHLCSSPNTSRDDGVESIPMSLQSMKLLLQSALF